MLLWHPYIQYVSLKQKLFSVANNTKVVGLQVSPAFDKVYESVWNDNNLSNQFDFLRENFSNETDLRQDNNKKNFYGFT